jgi:hypothetical protein
MHDGVTAASGVASYVLNVNGIDQTAVAAVNSNIRVQPTLYQIGSFSPAPTLIQSGVQFTIAAKGTGIDDATSDQLGFAGWEIPPNTAFDLYCDATQFSGLGSIYSPGGLMWRDCTAVTCAASAGKRYGAIYRFLSANNSGAQVKDRLTVNTIPTARASTTGNNSERWLRIRKVKVLGLYNYYYQYSVDGSAWITAYSWEDTGAETTLMVGAFVSDLQNAGSASAVMTLVVDGLFYTSGAQTDVTKAYTTGTTVTGKWKAKDVNGNSSGYSVAITASGAGAGAPVTWNPGHYLRFIPYDGVNWYYDVAKASIRQSMLDFIDTIPGQTPNVKGIEFSITIGTIETSFGVYDWSPVDTIVAKIKSYGYRYRVIINTQADFISTASFPQYMLDDKPTYFAGRYANNQYDCNLRWWVPSGAPQQRLIAFQQAFAARYGTDAKFESIKLTWESSFEAYTFNTATFDPAYTYANTLAGWTAIAQAWHTAAPTKMSDQWWNGFKDFTLETAQEYYAVAAANNCMWNSPNSVHNTADIAQIAALGMNYNGQLPGSGSSFIDYTTIMPMCAAGNDANDFYAFGPSGDANGVYVGTPYQTLAQQWADKSASRTATNIPTGSGTGVHGAFAWNLPNPLTVPWNRASHYVWFVNTFAGNSTDQWPQSLPAFINASIAATPAPTAPTCFASTGYITGG